MDKTSKNKKYSGFTLIEILIGTLIFAAVMVMTTGAVGQSVGYQSKVRAIRQTSAESRRLAEMISRDVREARGDFTVAYTDSTGSQKAEYDSGLALFNCSATKCTVKTEAKNIINEDITSANNINIVSPSELGSANTMLVKSENKIKIYFFYRGTAQVIYYYEYDPLLMSDGKFLESDGTTLHTLEQVLASRGGAVPHKDGLIAGNVDTWANPTNSVELKTVLLSLQFYTPPKGTVKTKQVFIRFRIISELGSLANPREHSVSIISTTVTSRNYSL